MKSKKYMNYDTLTIFFFASLSITVFLQLWNTAPSHERKKIRCQTKTDLNLRLATVPGGEQSAVNGLLGPVLSTAA